MHRLLEILGEPVDSPRVQDLIARYSLVAREADDTDEAPPSRRTLANPSAGLQLQIRPDDRVATVFIHGEGKDGFTAFADPLPGGVRFDQKRDEVRATLGPPSRSKGSGYALFTGPHGGWDRYDRKAFSVHIEYRHEEGRIELVTLMLASEVPGR